MVSLPTRGTSRRFDGFFGHQSHRPTGEALGRIAADHGNNALLLAVFQQRFGSRPLLLVKSPFQPAFLIAMADFADRLRRQRHHARNPGRTDPFGQLQSANARNTTRTC